jgi:hypothetical protein
MCIKDMEALSQKSKRDAIVAWMGKALLEDDDDGSINERSAGFCLCTEELISPKKPIDGSQE